MMVGLFACPMMKHAVCDNAQIRLLGFCISFHAGFLSRPNATTQKLVKWHVYQGESFQEKPYCGLDLPTIGKKCHSFARSLWECI